MSTAIESSLHCRRLHVVCAPVPGGVFQHVHDLLCFDPNPGAGVLMPPWPGLDRTAARLRGLGVPVVRLGPPPRRDGMLAWLAAKPAPLAHVHFSTPDDALAVLGAVLQAGMIAVTTDHMWAPPHGGGGFWAERAARARAQAAVLADSAAVAAALATRLGVAVETVPHGIDPQRFDGVVAKDEARAQLGLPRVGPSIGVVSALFSTKGVVRVVEAAARLPGPPLLVVAGEGPERPHLVARADRLAVRARWLGWQDDVRPVLAASDVVALASDGEGLPTVVLEALAAGRPVVATDAGGTREALGPHGLLVAPGDGAAFASALGTVLSGELRFDAVAARAHVAWNFDIRRTAARVSAIHQAALAAR